MCANFQIDMLKHAVEIQEKLKRPNSLLHPVQYLCRQIIRLVFCHELFDLDPSSIVEKGKVVRINLSGTPCRNLFSFFLYQLSQKYVFVYVSS